MAIETLIGSTFKIGDVVEYKGKRLHTISKVISIEPPYLGVSQTIHKIDNGSWKVMIKSKGPVHNCEEISNVILSDKDTFTLLAANYVLLGKEFNKFIKPLPIPLNQGYTSKKRDELIQSEGSSGYRLLLSMMNVGYDQEEAKSILRDIIIF